MADADEETTRNPVATVDHRHLRPAIEFAVAIADAGQRLRPPIAFPAALKPFLKQPRVPAAALGKLRRAIEADAGFRRRLAAGALPELVDAIGIEWLQRDDGWEERLAKLVDEAERSSHEAGAEAARRRAEKRREAAEQAAARTRAELVTLGERNAELTTQLAEQRALRADVADAVEAARGALADARAAARHADDRAAAARARLAGVEAERDVALSRAAAAEVQRDAVLADRAEQAGLSSPIARLSDLRDLSRAARSLADRLGAIVDVGPQRRKALALPGGVARDSRRAAEFLLRAPGAAILIDGYNVAKQAWPDDTLERQRERCLDLVDDLARRQGNAIAVIFDGADIVGSHTSQRRLARVVYSPAGVTADDVIRAEVTATPPQRPVVVVTNDQAIRRDVAADGANLVTTDAFLSFCT